MFFAQEVLVDCPVERTVMRLSSWVAAEDGEAAAVDAMTAGGGVLARAGFAGLSKTVEVRAMQPRLRDGITVIGLRWSATGPLGDLFPTVDANLEISAADAGQSRVALIGSYRPPLGPMGELLDRVVLNRAGRVTIRRWLHGARTAVTAADHPHAPGSRSVVHNDPRVARVSTNPGLDRSEMPTPG